MSRIYNRITQLEAHEAEERARLNAEIEAFKALGDMQLDELAGTELANLSDAELEQFAEAEGRAESLADKRAALAQLRALSAGESR